MLKALFTLRPRPNHFRKCMSSLFSILTFKILMYDDSKLAIDIKFTHKWYKSNVIANANMNRNLSFCNFHVTFFIFQRTVRLSCASYLFREIAY